jgi:hypothetical protein
MDPEEEKLGFVRQIVNNPRFVNGTEEHRHEIIQQMAQFGVSQRDIDKAIAQTRTKLLPPWPQGCVVEDNSKYGNLNDVLVPCDLDEETNLPIDVITDEPIPKEKLIRIRCNGILRCYNIDTLVDTLQRRAEDPFTRTPVSQEFINEVIERQAGKYKRPTSQPTTPQASSPQSPISPVGWYDPYAPQRRQGETQQQAEQRMTKTYELRTLLDALEISFNTLIRRSSYLNGRQSSIPALQEDLDTVRILKEELNGGSDLNVIEEMANQISSNLAVEDRKIRESQQIVIPSIPVQQQRYVDSAPTSPNSSSSNYSETESSDDEVILSTPVRGQNIPILQQPSVNYNLPSINSNIPISNQNDPLMTRINNLSDKFYLIGSIAIQSGNPNIESSVNFARSQLQQLRSSILRGEIIGNIERQIENLDVLADTLNNEVNHPIPINYVYAKSKNPVNVQAPLPNVNQLPSLSNHKEPPKSISRGLKYNLIDSRKRSPSKSNPIPVNYIQPKRSYPPSVQPSISNLPNQQPVIDQVRDMVMVKVLENRAQTLIDKIDQILPGLTLYGPRTDILRGIMNSAQRVLQSIRTAENNFDKIHQITVELTQLENDFKAFNNN